MRYFLSVLFLFAASCSIFQENEHLPVTGYELGNYIYNTSRSYLPESEEYENINGYFDQRFGVIVTGRFAKRVNPMAKGKNFYGDLERNEKLARYLSRLPYLRGDHKVVIALKTPMVDQVRSWSVSYLRANPDNLWGPDGMQKDPDASIADRMYIYNGIESNEGGYPEWTKINDALLSLQEDLQARGYASSAFIMPLFGLVLAIHEPVENLDRLYMQSFHRKSYYKLKDLSQFSPTVLLLLSGEGRRINIMHDIEADSTDKLYTVVYAPEN